MAFLTRRLTGRCETHDRPSQPRIRDLEQQFDIEPSATPDNFVEAYSNPDLIDCGHHWCQQRR
ncbi:hypothetical protein ACFVU3_00490 [Streptomyces sp. NPDC058052]|uniref:hypothetical protein n=1 Tax=Streptomyces sp. NPDC058052 TaxID=3346316 RepID=UPI0036EC9237